MPPGLRQRIDYGRVVRVRALCLIEAHGAGAGEMVRQAATDSGLPIAERSFLEAVAVRVARLTGGQPAI